MSTDPLRNTDLANPQGWNAYAYVLNNPINRVDPDGRLAETVFDVTMAGVSIKQAWDDPGFWNVAGAVLDVAAVAIPIVPAVGGRLIDAAQAGNRIVDAGQAANRVDNAADAAKATEGIYEVTAQSGKTYVGQSKNIPTRLEQHMDRGKISGEAAASAKTTTVGGGKTAREIAEQRRINELGGVQNLENKRNPIGRAREYLLRLLREPEK